mgnify:CR=1 FL=1
MARGSEALEPHCWYHISLTPRETPHPPLSLGVQPASAAATAAVGLAMVPVNLFVGLASSHISDRSMVVAALLATSAGLALLTQTTAAAAFYFVGGVTLFVGKATSR